MIVFLNWQWNFYTSSPAIPKIFFVCGLDKPSMCISSPKILLPNVRDRQNEHRRQDKTSVKQVPIWLSLSIQTDRSINAIHTNATKKRQTSKKWSFFFSKLTLPNKERYFDILIMSPPNIANVMGIRKTILCFDISCQWMSINSCKGLLFITTSVKGVNSIFIRGEKLVYRLNSIPSCDYIT